MFNKSQVQNILGTLYTSGSIIFHPTQSRVYTPLANRVKCLDLKNNTTAVLPLEANRNIKLITINPQGSILVVCDTKNNLIVYNLLAEFVVGRVGLKGEVRVIEFSSDGKLFAVGEERGFKVYLSPPFWRSLEPLVLIKKYTNRHSLPLTGLGFSPDSRFLLTHGKEPRVFLNNLVSLGKEWSAPSFEVHKYEIVNSFFENERMEYLYTVDKGGNLFVWKWVEEMSEKFKNRREMMQRRAEKRRGGKKEAVVKKEEYQEEEEEKSGEDEVDDDEALEIEDRKEVTPLFKEYSAFEKKALNGRFILATKLIVSQPASQVTHCKYLPHINLLATTHTNGKFAVWKLEKDELSEIYSYSAGNHEITSLSISPDGHWIVLGIEELGQLIVWEWRSQTYIINQSGRIIDGICSEISSDHKVIAVGTQHGKVRVWDRVTGFCLATFPEEHQGEVSAVKFSNKTTLFSSSLDGTVQAYDLNKYKRFRVFRPDKKAQLTSLAIDESGEMVCAGAFDPYEIYCWNIQTARLLQIITGHTAPITCLTFVGEQLLTGGWDRHLRIHEFFSRKLNTEILDHGSEITAIAIHPFKTQVAVSTLRGEVYIWKVPDTNEMVGILDCQTHWKKQQDSIPITSLAYSCDGEYLVVGGKHKDLLIFDIKYRTLVRRVPLTNNTAYKGVQEFLNSKMIREGVNLEDIQVYSDDDRLPDESLPGSKKLDISKQERQLEVTVHSISTSQSNFYVGTSFGVLVFGISKKFKFSPFETTGTLTPQMMIEALKSKSYSQGLSIALKLGIPIPKILPKIPEQVISKVVDELGYNLRNRLIEELGRNELEQINLMWLRVLLNYDIKMPKELLLRFQRIRVIDGIVGKIGGIVEAGRLLKYEKAEEEWVGEREEEGKELVGME